MYTAGGYPELWLLSMERYRRRDVVHHRKNGCASIRNTSGPVMKELEEWM